MAALVPAAQTCPLKAPTLPQEGMSKPIFSSQDNRKKEQPFTLHLNSLKQVLNKLETAWCVRVRVGAGSWRGVLSDTGVHLPSLADLGVPPKDLPAPAPWWDGIPPRRSDRITRAPCVMLVPSNCFLVTFYC